MNSIWVNPFFYLFVTLLFSFGTLLFLLLRVMKQKSSELGSSQKQHLARIDNIRKEHTEKLENLRVEMLKREEERSRQWIESEKETLHVLNGVTSLLDLSDRVEKIQFKNLNEGLLAIKDAIIKEKDLNKKLKLCEEKYHLLFNNSIVGIALHEMIYDDKGKPLDYRYISTNKSFGEFTGLNHNDIIGKTILEIVPDIEKSWIDNFGRVAMTGIPMSFENYSGALKNRYKVTAYSPEPNKFVAIFMVIS